MNSDDQIVFRAGRKMEHMQRGGLRGKIVSWFFLWREGRRATRICQELLMQYHKVLADHPELHDRDHYRQLIMTREKCNPSMASEILNNAAESFASWPVPRELTLCDVVHYLTARELAGSPEGDHRVHSSLHHLVETCISKSLIQYRTESTEEKIKTR